MYIRCRFYYDRKFFSDRRESSYCECCSVYMRFKKNCTTGRNICREFTIQSWKFLEEEFFQRTTDRIKEAYVCFCFMKFNFNHKFLHQLIIVYIFIYACRLDVRTIEEADKSGTDPEDEATYADIPSVTEYRDVFQPSRACK